MADVASVEFPPVAASVTFEPDAAVLQTLEVQGLTSPAMVEWPEFAVVPGPPGPPGQSGAGYVHTQLIAATVWIIPHNLGFRPDAVALNEGGQVVTGEILHLTINTLSISFLLPVAGSARLT